MVFADSVEYNNMQIYLADANGDGVVTIHDRTAIEDMLESSE